jgi:hypothetical protein
MRKRAAARTSPGFVAGNSGTVLVEDVELEDAVVDVLVELLTLLVLVVVVVDAVLVVDVVVLVEVTARIAEACNWRTCALPLSVNETNN